ncbi:LUC7 [Candida pseudojiufengensis]|uniref:LUC7 n=1 Tax=Candida pseudojiufengensis TaxID=497109 RepID=UPI002224A259|nr:LUC7 [Candida pseudojiufengensis]KAI5965662.1 LUC7 [Candida pseudojiufengensis]
MAEEQRRQIEQLMGKQSSIRHYREPGLTSPQTCKAYIVGICPHDLFVGTKSDLGKCPNLHLQKHKLEYEYKTKTLNEKFPEMEYQYFQILQKYIHDLDRTISIAQKRLEHTPEEKARILEVTSKLDNLDFEIGLMIQELQFLIKQNTKENDHSLKIIKLSINLDQKFKDRDEASNKARFTIENIGQTSQQKLQVCDGCGAYLSRLDNDRRLADHFVGKIHLGYVQLRQAYDELKVKY